VPAGFLNIVASFITSLLRNAAFIHHRTPFHRTLACDAYHGVQNSAGTLLHDIAEQ
jgi:hypothetical protein